MEMIHTNPSTVEEIKQILKDQNIDSTNLRIYEAAG